MTAYWFALVYNLALLGATVYLIMHGHPWWAGFLLVACTYGLKSQGENGGEDE